MEPSIATYILIGIRMTTLLARTYFNWMMCRSSPGTRLSRTSRTATLRSRGRFCVMAPRSMFKTMWIITVQISKLALDLLSRAPSCRSQSHLGIRIHLASGNSFYTAHWHRRKRPRPRQRRRRRPVRCPAYSSWLTSAARTRGWTSMPRPTVARVAPPRWLLVPSATASISIGRLVMMAGMVIAAAFSTPMTRGARTVVISRLTIIRGCGSWLQGRTARHSTQPGLPRAPPRQ